MDNIQASVEKAKKISNTQGGMSPETAKQAGKEIGKEIDARNGQNKSAKDNHYNRELHEITRYHTRRAEKQTKYFI